MYESFVESLKEHLKNIDFDSIKEFFTEFGEKLHSSNNLACLIALLFIDLLAIAFLMKANKEKKSVIAKKSKIVSPYGLAIGDRYYPFKADEILIGRHSSCDIRSVNMTVSRYHAIISLKDGQWCIEDMDSTHGTFVNGEQIDDITPIYEGDEIQLGEIQFTVENSIHRQQRQQENQKGA
ncbi:MAG: FHA domain-containing protein [Ruminococcus sp.]|nr:FHA domain-containing protein [Ruminococcus sp.]MCD7800928.1 FHA domain-containing protein [Ruminococcus sp.]